jgi:hypothetical protein
MRQLLIDRIKKIHPWYILDGEEGIIVEQFGKCTFCMFSKFDTQALETILLYDLIVRYAQDSLFSGDTIREKEEGIFVTTTE